MSRATEKKGYKILRGKSDVFYDTYTRKGDLQHQTHYCPGCGHGIAHKLIAETLEDMGLTDRAVFVSPVGCSVFGYYYFHTGNIQAAHGRAPAVATAVKRSRPDSIVIAYQGDGDLAAIGTAEIIHAANRGERISVFFINNAIYGMTGGQMAPTTLVGQVSTTSPWGRRPVNEGYPIHAAELLSSLEAPAYIERVSMADAKSIMRARKAVRKALELQRDGVGFTFVEMLSPCPTVWKMTPAEARSFVKERMLPVFPLKNFRDRPPEQPEDHPPEICAVKELLASSAMHAQGAAASANPLRDTLSIKVAGFGGQGVLLLGQLLAEMGLIEGLGVSWLPSYGPEMRSGSAHCHVCLSRERIGSPLISHANVLIAMNEISLRKFAPEMAEGGVILYNRDKAPDGFSLPPHVTMHCVPASEIADKQDATKAANVVMLGAFLELTGSLQIESANAALQSVVKNKKFHEMNRKALEAGAGFALLERQAEALPHA